MDYKFQKNYLDEKSIEWKAMRNGAGIGMAELGAEKENMVVLGADTTESSRAHYFAEKFPERFIQVGVAEQNLIGISAGLAYEGMVPYAVTYAPFLIGRAWEPIRTTIAYPNNHVIFVSSHAGLATGPDGPTHQMTEDVTLTRTLPNFTVICPADYEQARLAVKAAYDLKGPVYVRNARENTPVFTTEKTPFEIGKAQKFMEGRDITIFSSGPILYEAMKAAHELKEGNGISCEVINVPTIKPLDEKVILAAAEKTRKVVTVEEHQVKGGLGGAIAELLARKHPTPMEFIGMQDSFGESGQPDELLEKYGMSKEAIKNAVKKVISRKNGK